MTLPFDRVLQWQTRSLPVSHPVLQHEGRRRRITDGAAMGAPVRQRVDTIIREQRALKKIQIAVGVVQKREVDHTGATIAHHEVVHVLLRRDARGLSPLLDRLLSTGLIVKTRQHFVLHRKRAFHQIGNQLQIRPNRFAFLSEQPAAEVGILQLFPLLRPGFIRNRFPARSLREGVESGTPSKNQARAAHGNLSHDVGATRVLIPHRLQLTRERQLLDGGLKRRKGHGGAGLTTQITHPVKLVPLGQEIAGDLKDTMTCPLECAANPEQFLLGRGCTGYQFAINRLVQHGTGCRKAQRTGIQSFLDDSRHPGDLCLSRRLIGRTPITHDVGTHRAVGHLRGHIHRSVQLLQSIQILGKRLPIPGHALGQSAPGNIFNAFHQTDQPLLPVGRSGRKADTAIAHYNCGHTMP